MRNLVNSRFKKIEWLILALLIFIPRLFHLNVFLTIDEPLFLDHARRFAVGLSSGDLSRTLGIGYPGVTVAWWSAPVVGLASTELGAYVAGRLATAAMTGLLLLVLYGLAHLLLGRWPAFIGVSLLALDPYALAYSRLLHIAAPLALFMTLAGLTCLLWLRDAHRRWLLLTGLFTGLALLTKSTALLLGPLLGIIIMSWTVGMGQWRNRVWWLSKLGGLLIIVLVAMVTFFILWPAMWADPAQALILTFSKLFTDQEAGAGNLGFFWLGRFVEDPGPTFYPVAFLLKSTPWLLIGLLLSLLLIIKEQASLQRSRITHPCPEQSRRDASRTTDYALRTTHHATTDSQPSHTLTITLWLFALTYLILMTIASKKSIRYMLPAFPTFYLLVGSAFYQIFSRWKIGRLALSKAEGSKNWEVGRFFPQPSSLPTSQTVKWLFAFLLLFSISFIVLYHPYYFTYYNPLVLGWRWAPKTLLVGWGEGLDEAARYLNDQPQGAVAAWYESIFPIFYNGQVEPVVPQENLITADRTVLYLNQVQRDIPSPNVIHYFQTRRQSDYTASLNGIEYAWVYSGPIAGLDQPNPTPQYTIGGDFGGETQLLGYNLHPQPRSGDPLIVTLYWRVLTSPPTERFVYLRLVDGQGRIWAQADGPPVMGLWPVDRWQPGMLIEDAQELPIPPGTPPGTYHLEVGLYDPASGQVLPASGQPVGQGGGLLLGEVQVAWQSLRTESDLPHQTDTRLAPNARLIGYDAPPAAVTPGDVLLLRLAWREAKTLPALWPLPNHRVLFVWQPLTESRVARQPIQQFDELPLPIKEWGRGATLLSQHELIVYPTLEAGQYDLLVMLHTGSEPAGETFSLGTVEVVHPPHQFNLPAIILRPLGAAELNQNINLAGYLLEQVDDTLTLNLYWQTKSPLTTRYKVFAQLLAPDNTLAAQSDSFPATGQRPTTGWLPGEIIIDSHTLALPADLPPGNYQLITGLYNPTTGERLPILNENGEPVADAIFITEVTLP